MASPLIVPKFRAFTAAGAPLNGGKLYSYIAGTTTPLSTYTDGTLGVANANPVVLSAAGEADVWLGSSNYKFVLKDSADVTQWTEDNVSQAGLTVAGATNFVISASGAAMSIPSASTTLIANIGSSVGDSLAEWTAATGRFTPISSGNYSITFAGTLLQNGANVTISTAFNVLLYKNGVLYLTVAALSWPYATGAASNTFPISIAPAALALTVGDYIDIRVQTPAYTTATMSISYCGVSVRRLN